MGTVILITSGKGGTGKTTSAAAIASALALERKKTLAVDCDIGLGNLDLILGLADRVNADFADVLSGRLSAGEAIRPHGRIPNLWFLAAPAERVSAPPEAFRAFIRALAEEYDFILLDSPAGLGSGFSLAAGAADEAIVVATGDAASLRDGQKTVLALHELGLASIRLLVNRVKPRYYRRLNATVDDVIDGVGARLIGVIREDEGVPLAADLGEPLMLRGARLAYDAYYRVALRLIGARVPLE